MKNVGKVSRQWLREVGIESVADLRRCGSIGAFQAVRTLHPQLSLNFLWTLEGAILDIDWRDIPAPRKQQLRLAVGR